MLPSRAFTTSILRSAEGDTGSIRAGGSRAADTWSRREKAAEDMYIHEREKEIVKLMKEKIAEQEAKLVRPLWSLLGFSECRYADSVLVGERPSNLECDGGPVWTPV